MNSQGILSLVLFGMCAVTAHIAYYLIHRSQVLLLFAASTMLSTATMPASSAQLDPEGTAPNKAMLARNMHRKGLAFLLISEFCALIGVGVALKPLLGPILGYGF